MLLSWMRCWMRPPTRRIRRDFERMTMNAHHKLNQEPAATFVRRHIGPSPRDVQAMLETVGAKSLDALMAETVKRLGRLPLRF